MKHDGDRVGSWEGADVERWQSRWDVPSLCVYRSVGSTNDVARRMAEGGAVEGSVVLADEQSSGRGRGGTRWHDQPRASLLVSIILRPRLPQTGAAAPGTLPLRVGLAVAEAVEQLTGAHTRFKWPNDVMIERSASETTRGSGPTPPGHNQHASGAEIGRKVAGILCEAALSTSPASYVVVGVGVNVAQDEDDFPPELRARATSLRLETRTSVSRPELAHAIIARVRALGEDAIRPLDDETRQRLAARDALAGQNVTVDGRFAGRAVGVAADGALRIQDDQGIRMIRAGSVRAVP